ncbi:hypothetical protein Tco_0538125 [Tanacetum coccineum]
MGFSTLNLQTTLVYPNTSSSSSLTKPINLKFNKIPYFNTNPLSFNNRTSRYNNIVCVPAKKKKNPTEEKESVISPSIVDEVSQDDDEFYEFDDDDYVLSKAGRAGQRSQQHNAQSDQHGAIMHKVINMEPATPSREIKSGTLLERMIDVVNPWLFAPQLPLHLFDAHLYEVENLDWSIFIYHLQLMKI